MADIHSTANELINLFAQYGHSALKAGGCVRDKLLKVEINDIDLAIDATPDEQKAFYEELGLKYIETGVDHGTYTVIFDDHHFEVTSLRADSNHNGRHCDVRFGVDWVEDASRRDLTINSLYENANGEITDFFDGESDLKEKRICFVGDAEERIKEDYLRILRALRFFYTFKTQYHHASIEANSNEAIKKHFKDIKNHVSKERINEELSKTWKKTNVAEFFNYIAFIHHYDATLLNLQKLPHFRNVEHVKSFAQFFATCFNRGATEEIKKFADSVRLKGFTRQLIQFYNENRNVKDVEAGFLQRRVSKDQLDHWNKNSEEQARELTLEVNGEDAINAGLKGKAIGEALNRLAEQVVHFNKCLTREEQIAFLSEKQ